MKASHSALARTIALTGALALSACVPAPDSTPTPTPEPVQQAPAPAPTPAERPDPVYANWLDAPQTQGRWTYSSSQLASGRYAIADFLAPDGSRLFTIMCSASGNVILQRWVSSIGELPLTIRTETQDRTVTAPRDPEGRTMVAAVLRANDSLLDAIALTRGRFAVETPEKQTLYLPAWAEVTRVIEDCR